MDAEFEISNVSSEITENKGTARILIYACDKGESGEALIKEYSLDTMNTNNDNRYVQVANHMNGTLEVDSEGLLFYKVNNHSFRHFTVKLGRTGTCYPGDDILLRFGILNQPQYNATVRKGDFLSIFDKKMLDYANQYINETITEAGNSSGMVDWNGSQQISINKWRRFSDNIVIQNAIAYSLWARDSVEQFNSEINKLNSMDNDSIANTWLENNFPAFEIYTKNDVQYYRAADPKHSVPGLSTFAAYGNPFWDYSDSNKVFKDKDGNALDADSGILDKGNIRDENADENKKYWNLSGDLGLVSSGLDCSGLVSKSTLYSGTNYTIVDIFDDSFTQKEGTWQLEQNIYSTEIPTNLLVPGDIVIMVGHVAIVQSVNFSANSRDLGEPSQYTKLVSIIHSTSGVKAIKSWRVFIDKWSELFEAQNYKIRRLKID